MKKKYGVLLLAALSMCFAACGIEGEREDIPEEEEIIEAVEPEAEVEYDFEFDNTVEYGGYIFTKIPDFCYEDIELNPIGKVDVKCYQPPVNEDNLNILIRLYTKKNNGTIDLTDPLTTRYPGYTVNLMRMDFCDFNEDGVDDIIVLMDYVNSEDGSDNFWVIPFYGNEQGCLIEDNKFEEAVNKSLDGVNESTAVYNVIHEHLDMIQ